MRENEAFQDKQIQTFANDFYMLLHCAKLSFFLCSI